MTSLTIEAVRAALEQSTQTGNFWLDMPIADAPFYSVTLLMGFFTVMFMGGMLFATGEFERRYARAATAGLVLGAGAGFCFGVADYGATPVAERHMAVANVILEADAFLRVRAAASPTPGRIQAARARVAIALQEAELMRRQLMLLNHEPLAAGGPIEKLDLAQLALLQKLARVN